jgi:peptidoglycan hydrolase-like protein with peptidoglycan-binding domain
MINILDGAGKSFDLLRNPFFVLKVEPSTPLDRIAEAAEDALADGVAEADIAAAREALINPRQRTGAELSYLFDSPSSHVGRLVKILRNLSFPEILKEAERTAPLSRSNFLTEAASRSPASADIIFSVLDAHAQISPPDLLAKIQSVRRQAGIVGTSLEAVEEALNALYERHVKALLAGLKNAKAASVPLRECTNRLLALPDDDRLLALDRLLRAYTQFASSELSELEESVAPLLEQLKGGLASKDDIERLSGCLRQWVGLAQPLIDAEARKGRDDPRSRELCFSVRSLSIERANQHNDFASALAISEIASTVFATLPRASEQLVEDVQLLKERINESRIAPLKDFIEGVSKWTIAADMSGGFGPSAKGLAAELWMLFSAALRESEHSNYADLPWMLIRGLAIDLNNEENSPEAAKVIVDQLLRLAGNSGPSGAVIEKLRDDLRAVTKNANEKRVLKLVEGGNTSAALIALDELLRGDLPPDERALYEPLRSRLRSQRNVRRAKWAVFGLVAAVIIGVNMSNNSRPTTQLPTTATRTSETSSSPYQAPRVGSDVIPSAPRIIAPPTEQINTAEVKPPVGSGGSFTRPNIRYCRYQKARLKSIESDLRSSFETDEFNKLADDYNSRCANFRYYENDLRIVDDEVANRGAALLQDGRAIVAAWRSRSIASGASSPLLDARGNSPNANVPQPPVGTMTTPAVKFEPVPQDDNLTNLLNIETANGAQKRLLDLGFFRGPVNGAWGPQSRNALRAFKIANGLTADDIYDVGTAERINSITAIRANPGSKPITSLEQIRESYYAPRGGTTLNPLNRDDAVRIHNKMRELGYYRVSNNNLWSAASRDALKEFKVRNGLEFNDAWDIATEQRLMAAATPGTPSDIESAFSSVVMGEWTTDLRACQGISGGSDALVVTMTTKGARTEGARCDFQSFSGSGLNWKVAAICTASGEMRRTTVTLNRSSDTLTWSSDKGIAKYIRCPS